VQSAVPPESCQKFWANTDFAKLVSGHISNINKADAIYERGAVVSDYVK